MDKSEPATPITTGFVQIERDMAKGQAQDFKDLLETYKQEVTSFYSLPEKFFFLWH